MSQKEVNLCLLQVSKCFVPVQRIIHILCQSKTSCATPKDDFYSVNLVFVLAQKFLKRHLLQLNILTGTKHFGTWEGQGINILVLELKVFICKFGSINRFAPSSIVSCEIATLSHEIWNYSMKSWVFVAKSLQKKIMRMTMLSPCWSPLVFWNIH